MIEDQSGTGTKRRLPIDGAFNRLHGWGGKGSGTIAYSNNKLELRTLDVASGNSRLVATAKRRQMGYGQQFEATVSPDGQWLAFTNEGRNFNAGLYLYQFATGQTYPVSGEFADVGSPTFSRDGKLLFFTASTNSGPAQVGLDMTTQEQPFRSGIYAAVLERGAKSPIAPVLANEDAKPDAAAEAEPKKGAKKPVAASRSRSILPTSSTAWSRCRWARRSTPRSRPTRMARSTTSARSRAGVRPRKTPRRCRPMPNCCGSTSRSASPKP